MHRFFAFFLHLGVFGPLILGVLDSSFLFLPFGNDILIVVLIARKHQEYAWYVLLAAAGSTAGVLLLDLVCRKGGEEGLRKMLKPKRYEYFEQKMDKRAGLMIALACIAPPPFPFTPVIAAASAFQYPRKRELLIVFFARLVRFSLVGLAAILLGDEILRIVKSGPFYWAMIGFIVLCAVGSAYSVYGWVKRSKRAPAARPA
ncbi:MAG TPA: VTT domain-containing protein [Bryobacteraceae bacterium]|nr:VTT domain-containing protein [Bryobacteraceae bacterium]